MKIPDEIVSLNPDDLDVGDETKALIRQLLNLVEQNAHTIQKLQEENQLLKDEIKRLKGEKGKPKILPNVPKKENDIPKRKKQSTKRKKRSKKQHIKVDRKEIRRVDPNILPPDAEHKGYRRVVVQDIKFETDNVEYVLERYYSASEGRVYEGKLPQEIDGEFGARLKAFVVYLYFRCRVPEKKIRQVLTEMGIIISEGQISNILTKVKKEEFTQEKESILEAGMKCTDYFHIDDTGGRHKGINHYVQVICTALFSAFFITRKKDKDTIREILGLSEDEKIEKIMMSDDARQFWFVAFWHALCWIHEIRHYRKLSPVLEYHRTKLREFLTEIWKLYDLLKEYKVQPTETQKEFLEQRFEEMFSTKTGYQELDERIALTKKKKERLLLVLKYPQIPLHNNPAEIALREFVLKRKISYGTRSEDGKTAWENMMTLLDTCRKQNVSFLDYIEDIFSNRYALPRLAGRIFQRAQVKSTVY